jgi:hypothetical protein
VENAGVVPDVEVFVSPIDYLNGVDPQLDRAVHEALALLGIGVSGGQSGKNDSEGVASSAIAEDSRRALEALKVMNQKDGTSAKGSKESKWPFATFAPYPGEESDQSESSESESDGEDDGKRKPRGASRRR